MFKSLVAMVRGHSHDTAQGAVDRNGVIILGQQICDCVDASASASAKKAVAIAIAQNEQEQKSVSTTNKRPWHKKKQPGHARLYCIQIE